MLDLEINVIYWPKGEIIPRWGNKLFLINNPHTCIQLELQCEEYIIFNIKIVSQGVAIDLVGKHLACVYLVGFPHLMNHIFGLKTHKSFYWEHPFII